MLISVIIKSKCVIVSIIYEQEDIIIKKLIAIPIVLLIQIHADFKPVIQLGTDLIIKKNLTKTIEVNNGYSAEIGIEYFDTNLPDYSTQFLIGYKQDKLERILKKKKNVFIHVKRPYISILEKYTYEEFHAGIGVTYQVKPTADYTYNHHTTREFDNALGFLSEVGYSINDHLSVNLKMTLIKFHIEVKRKKKTYKRNYNTSSLGLFLSYKF